MAQLSYSIEHKQAYPGGRADSSPMDAASAQNDDVVQIPWGLGVVRNPVQPSNQAAIDMLSAILPVDGKVEADFAGVVLYDAAYEAGYPFGTSTLNGVQVGNAMSLIKKGRVFVTAEDAVDPTKPVYLRLSANGAGTAAGQFRGTSDTTHTIQLTKAKWVGTRNADGLCALDLNYP